MEAKNVRWRVLLLILCLPLLWIGVRNSHDWSDDGAGYILQAQNMCTGKSQNETGYIFNPHYTFMGPPAYTVGFPLLLIPVYKTFEYSVYPYMLIMSAMLILYVIMMFVFLSSRIQPLYALLFCLIVAYNPNTLYMKAEIMCDISLAFFILSCIVLYERWRENGALIYPVLLALINGLSFSIKGSGIVISGALLIWLVLLFLRGELLRKQFVMRNTSIMIFGGVGVYYLLNHVLFPISNSGVSFFIAIIKAGDYYTTLLRNFDSYIYQFNYFFSPELEEWNALAKITSAAMLTFTMWGFILKIMNRIDLTEIVFVLYVFIVLVYPYNAGVRFVFPMLPFACYYSYLTIQQLALNFKHKTIISIALSMVVLLQYRTTIEKVMSTQMYIVDGPQRTAAQEAFAYIRNNTPANAIFNFRRPRALALYTKRRACCNFPWDKPEQVLYNIDSLQVDYCVTNTTDVNGALDSLLKIRPGMFTKIWNNEQFVIYKYR